MEGLTVTDLVKGLKEYQGEQTTGQYLVQCAGIKWTVDVKAGLITSIVAEGNQQFRISPFIGETAGRAGGRN